MGYLLTMTVGCKAEVGSPPLERIDLFRGVKKLQCHFSHGYKIAIMTIFIVGIDGTIIRKDVYDSDSLVVYLFDKSLRYSICGVNYSSNFPIGKLFLVENKDNSTTNIDSHFIEALSKLEFQKVFAK